MRSLAACLMGRKVRAERLLACFLAIGFCLGTGYSLLLPPLQVPDEMGALLTGRTASPKVTVLLSPTFGCPTAATISNSFSRSS